MSTPKEFYKDYQADNNTVFFNEMVVAEIMSFMPSHVFEFGCGTGKNLDLILKRNNTTVVAGLDISLVNCIHSYVKNNVPCVIIGDESYLGHLKDFGVVFTCSVLDHIEKIDRIMFELKRMARFGVVLGECIDHDPDKFYYKHDYESFGFRKVKDSDYLSPADNHNYCIWKWTR